MAETNILGLYDNPDSGADAMDGLHQAGFPTGDFGEHVPQHRLFRFPLFGAMIGFTIAVLFTASTQLAYPVVTGGKPILAIPAMVIITYELTMLSAVIMTVVGIIFESRLPNLKLGVYDTRITEGLIGVVVTCDDRRAHEAEEVLRNAGALEIKRA